MHHAPNGQQSAEHRRNAILVPKTDTLKHTVAHNAMYVLFAMLGNVEAGATLVVVTTLARLVLEITGVRPFAREEFAARRSVAARVHGSLSMIT